ncbi:MAG TPA: tRNA uridine-5-carboxymethylaminomethyl(34) synthesis GTPase MnmE [Trueperaceae bacterium]|nr:tRNA uridine-5-carboxymethylaminomethyl(34) synthesis GTPase MnmE [Trueperaceae bacterium]
MPLPPTGDTIAAIATAPGSAAIGVVRVSGPEAYAVADRLFRPARGAPPSRRPAGRAVFGQVVADAEGGFEVIDEALLVTFRAPHSYTGQDAVEIQTHGGAAVLRAVLDLCVEAGARPAGPGEYTLRAFLSGRLDLAQAESVHAMVEAQTDSARRNAALGLGRALAIRLDAIQDDVTAAYAALQASLDYPEEGVPKAELDAPLAHALTEVERLLATAEAGRISRHGARLALLGRPNAGKSSLLNALLGFERSIVSAAPGTTRDYLEAPLALEGVPITAIDTAGIRAAEDAVEASGVALSRRIADASDLCLILLDRSVPLDPEALALVRELPPERTLVVASKADLPAAWEPDRSGPAALPVSTVSGEGLDGLKRTIRERLLRGAESTELWITNERQAHALASARGHLRAAVGAPADVASLELQDALEALGQVTGRSAIAEETLASIFANFCVGK